MGRISELKTKIDAIKTELQALAASGKKSFLTETILWALERELEILEG